MRKKAREGTQAHFLGGFELVIWWIAVRVGGFGGSQLDIEHIGHVFGAGSRCLYRKTMGGQCLGFQRTAIAC